MAALAAAVALLALFPHQSPPGTTYCIDQGASAPYCSTVIE